MIGREVQVRDERRCAVLLIVWLIAFLTGCGLESQYPRQWWVVSGYQTDASNVIAGPYVTEAGCQEAAASFNRTRHTGAYSCAKH